MIIREAKREDTNVIADIWLMSMRNAHHDFKETYWTKQYKSIRIKYSDVRSDVYVCEEGGVVLGFGAFVRDAKHGSHLRHAGLPAQRNRFSPA